MGQGHPAGEQPEPVTWRRPVLKTRDIQKWVLGPQTAVLDQGHHRDTGEGLPANAPLSTDTAYGVAQKNQLWALPR